MTDKARFRDTGLVFANGARGRVIDIPSASPGSYVQALRAPHFRQGADMARVTIDGQLFLPPAKPAGGARRLPLVIVVPGSLGVAPSHVTHAETLCDAGFAACKTEDHAAVSVVSPPRPALVPAHVRHRREP